MSRLGELKKRNVMVLGGTVTHLVELGQKTSGLPRKQVLNQRKRKVDNSRGDRPSVELIMEIISKKKTSET